MWRVWCVVVLVGCGGSGPTGGPFGYVRLTSSTVNASFWAREGICPPTVESMVGACWIGSDDRACGTDVDAHAPADLAVSFPEMRPLVFEPDPKDHWIYGYATWPPGSVLTIDATGGDVPQFQGTVTIPTPVPAVDGLAQGTIIDRAQDLTLRWPAQPGMSLWVGISAGHASFDCQFDAGAGTGVIPDGVLSALPSGKGDAHADIGFTNEIHPEGWRILLQSYADVPDLDTVTLN